jgi:hypothetical protein
MPRVRPQLLFTQTWLEEEQSPPQHWELVVQGALTGKQSTHVFVDVSQYDSPRQQRSVTMQLPPGLVQELSHVFLPVQYQPGQHEPTSPPHVALFWLQHGAPSLMHICCGPQQ